MLSMLKKWKQDYRREKLIVVIADGNDVRDFEFRNLIVVIDNNNKHHLCNKRFFMGGIHSFGSLNKVAPLDPSFTIGGLSPYYSAEENIDFFSKELIWPKDRESRFSFSYLFPDKTFENIERGTFQITKHEILEKLNELNDQLPKGTVYIK